MSFQNIQDYMSFFFVGKYINGNNISVRNVAPNITDKKDIFSKTAKLINLGLNYNLASKNSLNYINEEDKQLEESTNNFFNEFNFRVQFDSCKRERSRANDRAIETYCRFATEGVLSADLFGNVKDSFINITDPEARKFYLSLIAGAYIAHNQLLGNLYSGYYSTHLHQLFFNSHLTQEGQPTRHLKIFNSENDLHAYLNTFVSFVYGDTHFLRAQPIPNASAIHNIEIGRISNGMMLGSNKLNSISLKTYQPDRYTTVRSLFLLDHMDLSSYYSVANSLAITKMHEIFLANNYTCPEAEIGKVATITYANNSLLNSPDLSRASKLSQYLPRARNANNTTTPFIYVLKLVMPKNKVVYILFSNIPEPFEQRYEAKMFLNFSFARPAFYSSENFKTSMDGIKTYLSNKFKTVNNNG